MMLCSAIKATGLHHHQRIGDQLQTADATHTFDMSSPLQPSAPSGPQPSKASSSPRRKSVVDASAVPNAAATVVAPVADLVAKASKTDDAGMVPPSARAKFFMSYPRGPETTPFARALKVHLEAKGHSVWMDEHGIAAGVDFMSAIGGAIKKSDALVAIIDEKFTKSTYCNNELAMAQGNGVQLFPILFRSMSFDRLPDGLQYMLASVNIIPFPDPAEDSVRMERLEQEVRTVLAPRLAQRTTSCLQRHGEQPKPVSSPAPAPTPTEATTVDTIDTAATASGLLAEVPSTVPELPDVVSERPGMLSDLRAHLLGFMSSGAVSLSSVKGQRTKVAAHGQGGIGKTTMAAALVADPMVRRAFNVIGWVSVGQLPSIIEMQRVLYQQITGEPLPAREGGNATSQLSDLRAACAGRCILVVLDDVWDRAHEALLNCIDPNTTSKLLVTTRIRGLLKGCDELALNLMTEEESSDLLLRSGGIDADAVDEPARAAARQVAKLVGYLPLYLGICGGIIADYEGGAEWQTELVELLQEDRIGVIDEAGGGGDDDSGTTACVVDMSLKMLKDKDAVATFGLLALCPEDVLAPVAVVQMMCTADSANISKVTALSTRRWLKMLLDRNLLQGSTTGGVQMHDIVRDLMRARHGADNLRQKQRTVVSAFVAQCPAGGWEAGNATGKYAAQALCTHMIEALLPDVLKDTEAQAWLDASDDVMGHPVVHEAAKAFGHKAVIALGEQCEAEGQLWTAAKRFGAAAITVVEQNLIKTFDAKKEETDLLKRACNLLVQTEQTLASRSLEVSLRGQVAMRLPWSDEYIVNGQNRIQELIKAGVDIASPTLLVGAGWAEELSNMECCGFNAQGEENLHKPEMQAQSLERGFMSLHYKTALDMVPRDDPYWVVAAAYATFSTICPAHRQHELGRQRFADFSPHPLLSDLLDTYEFAKHGPLLLAAPMGMDFMLMNCHAMPALAVYGDIHLARRWMIKVCELYEGMEDSRKNPAVFAGCYYGGCNITHSFLKEAGLDQLSLRAMKATHITFSEVEASAEAYHAVMQFFVFEGQRHIYSKQSFLIGQAKRRHWLLAPDEVGQEAMEAWLATAPAEWGSASQGDYVDTTPASVGFFVGGDCANVFESLGRLDEAITAAQTDLRNYATLGSMVVHSYAAIGRCQAKLGKFGEARAAFDAAIAEARRCELPFLEMLAHRDLILHVLDAEGARASQMAALGACISRMVLPPADYTAVLGSDLDAEAAIAAHNDAEQAPQS